MLLNSSNDVTSIVKVKWSRRLHDITDVVTSGHDRPRRSRVLLFSSVVSLLGVCCNLTTMSTI